MKSKKKDLGQFFTNQFLADFMVSLALNSNSKKMLDPAVGMGAFTKAVYSKNPQISITACEVDKDMVANFNSHNKYPCKMLLADYLSTDLEEKYDTIICNPPYNKFQEIPKRYQYISDFKNKYNVLLSGYSNLCVYFLVKSLNELKEGGKCCYIIPYEFLNTGYGTVIKEYLLKTNMLKSIFRFNNKMSLFDDAITTSCILLFENKKHKNVEFINISSLEELKLCKFENKKKYLYSTLSPSEKWLNLFDFSSNKNHYNNTVKVSTFGKVSRGIATGANSFFAINRSQIEEYGLSDTVCLPCITKAPDVNELVFTNTVFDSLANKNKKVFLFNGLQATSQEDYSYIKYGEKIGANKSYLTSHRNPWYALEEKKAAPIWICVFSREKIKIVRNEAGVKNLTTFHSLYLKASDDDFVNIMFCYLLTPIAQELIHSSRREYGDGLTKFEPNDLTSADMLDLRLLTTCDKRKILNIYSTIKLNNDESVIAELDSIFRKYIFSPMATKNIS